MQIVDLGAVGARQFVGKKVRLLLVIAFETNTIAGAQNRLKQSISLVCRHNLAIHNT
jgi:hypothetical protein